jgi:hypothetical protein
MIRACPFSAQPDFSFKTLCEAKVNAAVHLDSAHGISPYSLDARLRAGHSLDGTTTGVPARNFHGSFVAQIRNVLAAVRGHEQVLVSGEEGSGVFSSLTIATVTAR